MDRIPFGSQCPETEQQTRSFLLRQPHLPRPGFQGLWNQSPLLQVKETVTAPA